MKIIERNARYIVTAEPISQEAIAKARHAFIHRYGRNGGLEIRLGYKALNDMCAELGVDKIPAVFTNESVQGLLIKPDADLQPDEWIVGYADERINDVKA